MLEKKGTCSSCGFEKRFCMCGKKINTSGEHVMYQNYTDLRGIGSDYSTIRRSDPSGQKLGRKFMEELMPVDKETLLNWYHRSEIAEDKLCEYSIQHHIYGTKKTWTCHDSSRYCFICTLVQYVNSHRIINSSLSNLIDLSRVVTHITDDSLTLSV